ncbi:MAG TPA: histidine phosphatase family protein, partial [Candidatus Paceibacterota bacterium]|nr:histidine phosphatase family protein [Candidatus Paceibacterota bacterium]
MKTIYLVRHGESDINVSTTYMDDASPPLTDLGREQSRYLAKRAKNLKFEALIASPFERTKRTAEMIAEETGHPVEYCDLFVERTLSRSLIGRSKADPDAKAFAD